MLEATAFGHGAAHDDQIDAASMYLIETYLAGGETTISVPIGVIPLSAARRREQALSRFQPRLTERQHSLGTTGTLAFSAAAD